jgi:hypothetical protein
MGIRISLNGLAVGHDERDGRISLPVNGWKIGDDVTQVEEDLTQIQSSGAFGHARPHQLHEFLAPVGGRFNRQVNQQGLDLVGSKRAYCLIPELGLEGTQQI